MLAKCVAGRERDWEFARDALAAGLVDADILLSRVGDLPISAEAHDRIRLTLRGAAAGG